MYFKRKLKWKRKSKRVPDGLRPQFMTARSRLEFKPQKKKEPALSRGSRWRLPVINRSRPTPDERARVVSTATTPANVGVYVRRGNSTIGESATQTPRFFFFFVVVVVYIVPTYSTQIQILR